jgi:hypothetical protein
MDSFKSISITQIAQSAHFLFFLPGCGSAPQLAGHAFWQGSLPRM